MTSDSGSHPWGDGPKGCDISVGPLRNTFESLEHEAVVRIPHYEITLDSGGVG